jgi:hypothetical protein
MDLLLVALRLLGGTGKTDNRPFARIAPRSLEIEHGHDPGSIQI